MARDLIAQGRSIDLGLGQINSANLQWLGLSIEAAFEPCANLKAAAQVLLSGYRPQEGRRAFDAALSRYNTGHPRRGLANGYVARVAQIQASLARQATASSLPIDRGGADDVFASRTARSLHVFRNPPLMIGALP